MAAWMFCFLAAVLCRDSFFIVICFMLLLLYAEIPYSSGMGLQSAFCFCFRLSFITLKASLVVRTAEIWEFQMQVLKYVRLSPASCATVKAEVPVIHASAISAACDT